MCEALDIFDSMVWNTIISNVALTEDLLQLRLLSKQMYDFINFVPHTQSIDCLIRVSFNINKIKGIQWMMDRKYPMSIFSIHNATFLGDLNVLEYIFPFFFKTQEDCKDNQEYIFEFIEIATMNGMLHILKWFYDLNHHQNKYYLKNVLNIAAEFGHMPIVLWIHSCLKKEKEEIEGEENESSIEYCSTYAMNWAAHNNHLHIIKWLHENRSEGCNHFAMNSAAANGHLDVVKWLHQNRNEGCTVNAMDYAAKEGQLHVIKWLHKHRSEGCTQNAMDYAAKEGHLDVIIWLHKNRKEGCTKKAMSYAALKNHLHVVQWLYYNKKDAFCDYALELAAIRGNLNIVKWFVKNKILEFTNDTLISATIFGQNHVILWWYNNYGISDNDMTKLLWEANKHKNRELYDWFKNKIL